jgi:hypothetical protein
MMKVWRKRGSVIQRISVLEANKARIETDIRKTAADYTKEPEGTAKNGYACCLKIMRQNLKLLRMTSRAPITLIWRAKILLNLP